MKSLNCKKLFFTVIIIFSTSTIYPSDDLFSSSSIYKTSNLTPKSSYDNVRIKNLLRFHAKLQSELDLLAYIQNLFGKKFITFGSARIRKYLKKTINGENKTINYPRVEEIFKAGEIIGKLSFSYDLIAATGAGPGTMEVMPRGWLKAFIISNIPDGVSMDSIINIVKNNPEENEDIHITNERLEIIRNIKEKNSPKLDYLYDWFADKIMGLLDIGLSPENIEISFSHHLNKYTTNEIEQARKKLEIAQKLKEIIQHLPHTNFKGIGTQGIKINLPFEAATNPFIIDEYYFTLFFTRKLALLAKGIGSINFAPGYGTIDEVFDAWVRKVPLAFYGKYIWEPILNAWENSFKKAGFIFPDYFITDDAKEAFYKVLSESKKIFSDKSYFHEVETTRILQKELNEVFPRYMLNDPAIVFVGDKPTSITNQYEQNLNILKKISSYFVNIGQSVRIASSSLLNPICSELKASNKTKLTQLMIMNSDNLSHKDNELKNEIKKNQSCFEVNYHLTHRILTTENSLGFIFLPGGIDTINILFDVLTRMQTGKIDKKPIVLIDPSFWIGTDEEPGFFSIIKKMSYEFAKQDNVFGVPLISEKDIDFIKVVNNEDDAIKVFSDLTNYSFQKDKKTEGFLDYWKTFILSFTKAA